MTLSCQTWQPEITLPTDVSKSCNLSECCLHSLKHSKRYNRAKTKTFHLPGYALLIDTRIRLKSRYQLQFWTILMCLGIGGLWIPSFALLSAGHFIRSPPPHVIQ